MPSRLNTNVIRKETRFPSTRRGQSPSAPFHPGQRPAAAHDLDGLGGVREGQPGGHGGDLQGAPLGAAVSFLARVWRRLMSGVPVPVWACPALGSARYGGARDFADSSGQPPEPRRTRPRERDSAGLSIPLSGTVSPHQLNNTREFFRIKAST
jgi:hypothetical protein